jgi:PIN domain nuclease of toxin-antitoxin system
MSAVLDTHAVLWYLLESSNLSQVAFALIDRAASVGTPVYLSAISVVEVAYLAERGRIPPDAFDKLIGALEQENAALVTVPVDLKIAAVLAVLKTIPRDAVRRGSRHARPDHCRDRSPSAIASGHPRPTSSSGRYRNNLVGSPAYGQKEVAWASA